MTLPTTPVEKKEGAWCVDPEWIKEQRNLGWPDMHPEDFCHKCGAPNPNWSAPMAEWLIATEKWRTETGKEGICCPKCFQDMYSEAVGTKTHIVVSVWKGSWDQHGDVSGDAKMTHIMEAREAVVNAVLQWTEHDSYSADERISVAKKQLLEAYNE